MADGADRGQRRRYRERTRDAVGSHGLAIMRHRVRSLGGTLEMQRLAAQAGTRCARACLARRRRSARDCRAPRAADKRAHRRLGAVDQRSGRIGSPSSAISGSAPVCSAAARPGRPDLLQQRGQTVKVAQLVEEVTCAERRGSAPVFGQVVVGQHDHDELSWPGRLESRAAHRSRCPGAGAGRAAAHPPDGAAVPQPRPPRCRRCPPAARPARSATSRAGARRARANPPPAAPRGYASSCELTRTMRSLWPEPRPNSLTE